MKLIKYRYIKPVIEYDTFTRIKKRIINKTITKNISQNTLSNQSDFINIKRKDKDKIEIKIKKIQRKNKIPSIKQWLIIKAKNHLYYIIKITKTHSLTINKEINQIRFMHNKLKKVGSKKKSGQFDRSFLFYQSDKLCFITN